MDTGPLLFFWCRLLLFVRSLARDRGRSGSAPWLLMHAPIATAYVAPVGSDRPAPTCKDTFFADDDQAGR